MIRMHSRYAKVAWVCGLLLMSSVSRQVVAGCGCLSSGWGTSGLWSSAVVAVPVSIGSPVMSPIPQPATPAPTVASAPLVTLAPPPGTLGSTYRRKTRRTPTDKHPRLGMLIVRGLKPGFTVTVWDMEGFSNDQHVWQFETKSPLLPGLAHIYRVVVWDSQDRLVKSSVRTVRLIPGRIVELEY